MIIKACSSSGDYYNVEIFELNGKISITCDCPAGQFGNMCKHKNKIIDGDTSILFDSQQKSDLDYISKKFEVKGFKDYTTAIEKIEKAIKDLEKEHKKLLKRIQNKIYNKHIQEFSEYINEYSPVTNSFLIIEFEKYKMELEKKKIEIMLRDGF